MEFIAIAVVLVVVGFAIYKNVSKDNLEAATAVVKEESKAPKLSKARLTALTKAQLVEKGNELGVKVNTREVKSKIVNQDPLEKGKRKILNFGHTLGHAIESFYMQNGILHGEAIALGMKLETMLSNIDDITKEEIINFIEKTFELPKLPPLEELKPFLIQDKKNNSQQ